MLSALKVGDLMTRDVVSVEPEAKLSAAKAVMKEFGIRHLPVVTDGRLVGIISSGDIREAAPSDATSLSVWELNYLWDKLTVKEVMTDRVLTVEPTQPLKDALRLLVSRKFSSVPVVRDGVLVGILTETDVFNKLISVIEQEVVRE